MTPNQNTMIDHSQFRPQQIAELPWVKALRPSGRPFCAPLIAGMPVSVWHVPVSFTHWNPSPDHVGRWQDKKTFVAETWQKNPLVKGQDSGLAYSCGEVELVARLRNNGYDAVWVSEWSGFPHVPSWERYCVKRSEFEVRARAAWEADQVLRQVNANRHEILGKRGGHPDIAAATNGAEHIYVEYKGPGDSIKPKQYEWVKALQEDSGAQVRYVAAYGTVVKD